MCKLGRIHKETHKHKSTWCDSFLIVWISFYLLLTSYDQLTKVFQKILLSHSGGGIWFVPRITSDEAKMLSWWVRHVYDHLRWPKIIDHHLQPTTTTDNQPSPSPTAVSLTTGCSTLEHGTTTPSDTTSKLTNQGLTLGWRIELTWIDSET